MTPSSVTGVLPIQQMVANASPSAWRDGIVVESRAGSVVVAALDGGLTTLSTAVVPAIGEPVAFHPVAELVAVAGVRYPARAA